MTQSSDLTFITNEGDQTLLDRFKVLIKDTEFFDVLVGYFRTSGFFQIHESLGSVSKIRILVGLNVDPKAYELIGMAHPPKLNFYSSKQTRDKFKEQTINEMETSGDSLRIEQGIDIFLEWISNGKLEFRAYPHANIHSKVYISRFKKEDRDYGRVITGSSNFSASGFLDNLEFNVELKNHSDVTFALEKFEDLWAKSIDITEDYVDTIREKTWMNRSITPYEIFLKVLYEWFGNDIDVDDIADDAYVPDGFDKLNYQVQAVSSALKILDAYNGVFLSDVVGLGKTYVSALLAKELGGKKLVVCPPVLQEYWQEIFRDFGVRSATVVSHGKLDHILDKGTRYDYVFVDEAHRFRNEDTQSYEKLHRICWGNKVILVSATPLNNRIDDVYSQIKLFQVPRKSTIPGIPNLEDYFSKLRKDLSEHPESTHEFHVALANTYQNLRDTLLRHIMVRRTRNEIEAYFPEDLESQPFPVLGDPKRVVYEFDSDLEKVFRQTINFLKRVSYSRYTPLLYLKEDPSEFEKQSQMNIGGFMKSILVKRLESSFWAFKKTVQRFIRSYETFIHIYQSGSVYLGKGVNILDYLDNDNEDELLQLLDKRGTPRVKKYDSKDFRKELIDDLHSDLNLLNRIQSLWGEVKVDPKLDHFIYELEQDDLLSKNKLLVFTESRETGEYLYRHLEKKYGDSVMLYSSEGGFHQCNKVSIKSSRDLIRRNFDPKNNTSEDHIRILITTDVLSEGTNLHRSNIVINYDLPWNPIKVMQRVGRINRLGTQHSDLFVYNFFPTSKTDEHLGLKDNIKSKIQAFHETLGEDSKYLTHDESPSGWRLFGDNLLDQLEDKRNYEGMDEGHKSDLKYIRILRDIRDHDPDLFKKIQDLPRKSRSGHHYSKQSSGLITFFRRGLVKKFLMTNGSEICDLSFLEAVKYFECHRETPCLIPPPERFYELLQINQEGYNSLMFRDIHVTQPKKGKSNEDYILKRFQLLVKNPTDNLTDEDYQLLHQAITVLKYGLIPKFTIQTLKKEIERENDPAEIVSIIRNAKLNVYLADLLNDSEAQQKDEIVLSQYLHSE
ncbi:MAG: helicase-related protein [Bacteroidetes bacterium]|nr:helicase-related protein [Bacteroidota bacterium]